MHPALSLAAPHTAFTASGSVRAPSLNLIGPVPGVSLVTLREKINKFSVRQRADDPGITGANKAPAIATLLRKELARDWYF